MWIDVRTPQEFRSGHLQGAINIPVQHIRAGIAAASPDKNAPLNLYCRSGRRVEAAMQELVAKTPCNQAEILHLDEKTRIFCRNKLEA